MRRAEGVLFGTGSSLAIWRVRDLMQRGFAFAWVLVVFGLGSSGCFEIGGMNGRPEARASMRGRDAGKYVDAMPNLDAFFAKDPPPRICAPDGAVKDMVYDPGGTPECPDDKNREGCPCPLNRVGKQSSCWPGLRAHRNLGICHDGMTTCLQGGGEFFGVWGPCEGYQLPVPEATSAKDACQCFSHGRWAIDKASPCILFDGRANPTDFTQWIYHGALSGPCPVPRFATSDPTMWPVPETWGTNRLTVGCTGQFTLCYALFAGNGDNPDPQTDCTIARVCTSTYYSTPDEPQELPPLPGWTTPDPEQVACVKRFVLEGGYGELSVTGKTLGCEVLGNGVDRPLIFSRGKFCPAVCAVPGIPDNMRPPICARCQDIAVGGF